MTLAVIVQLIGSLLPQLAGLLNQAVLANATNDQASLDAIHAKARAMADALKPAGA
jgi:uncharacterized protein YmfQ (DUF2313 family)